MPCLWYMEEETKPKELTVLFLRPWGLWAIRLFFLTLRVFVFVVMSYFLIFYTLIVLIYLFFSLLTLLIYILLGQHLFHIDIKICCYTIMHNIPQWLPWPTALPGKNLYVASVLISHFGPGLFKKMCQLTNGWARVRAYALLSKEIS